jgi:hypothetical protein
MAAVPARSVTRLQGIVVPTTAGATTLSVNVNGNVIPARVIDPLVVQAGDPVAVDFVSAPSGQAEAWIVGRLASAPRPSQGVVATVPPSSSTITVTGSDGATYTAYFSSGYTPTVGDNVILKWDAGIPTVLGKVGTTAAPPAPAPVAPPPSAATTGTSTYAATDTSTWWGPGGWDSWAGGNNVYQGDYGSGPLTGAWWYGGSPSELAGRTITAIRFTLGARNGAGASSSPVTVNLKTHTSRTRPAGNVALGSAATGVTAQPWQGGTVYSLPLSFAADLLAGGGIAITGGSYAGFNGRNKQADSGLLSIDWSR